MVRVIVRIDILMRLGEEDFLRKVGVIGKEVIVFDLALVIFVVIAVGNY